jgi:uncharacterized RDD family membrane protein YckC
MRPPDDSGEQRATLARRALSLIYEALLLAALLLAGSLPFVMMTQGIDDRFARPLLQVYLVVLTGAYFTWQWLRGGRTLAMKTWRLRVVARGGAPLTWRHVLKRYFVALAGSLLLGTGFLWALVDREGLFLHDRLAGTKIIKEEGESRKAEAPP